MESNETCSSRPDHENRRPSARRGHGGRQRQGHGCRLLRHGVARPRARHAQPRPARCLGVHPAYLRRLHDGARARLGARRGGCAADPHPEERELHPEHHGGDADGAGSSRPFLSPSRARLGEPRRGARRGPHRDGEPPEHGAQYLQASVPHAERERDGGLRARFSRGDAAVLRGDQGQGQGHRRERPARHLRGELVGSSRLQAAAA